METQTHFQSQCPHFQKNRIAAHHQIVQAVVGALKAMNLQGWTFFTETPFSELPFPLQWESPEEEAVQCNRRPDAVAWNAGERRLVFLKFTRAMDTEDNLAAALEAKGRQYIEAERAIRRAQRALSRVTTIDSVITAPLVFGVRGSVMTEDAKEGLRSLQLTDARFRRAMVAGVRAAITGLLEMCTARFEALKQLVRPPPPAGRRRRAPEVIPPKPWVRAAWRSDRGAAGGARG
mmetsp:Transcript_29555/g.60617  ORF Transcript_29555/g.60617 Transcript_29555/m.60617 type:complete len:234 (+) Transcript_29555:306-1007(+)